MTVYFKSFSCVLYWPIAGGPVRTVRPETSHFRLQPSVQTGQASVQAALELAEASAPGAIGGSRGVVAGGFPEQARSNGHIRTQPLSQSSRQEPQRLSHPARFQIRSVGFLSPLSCLSCLSSED